MRFALKADADTLAARVHTWMIANNAAYANSVTRGRTLRWAFSYQDLDTAGTPERPEWHVNLKARSFDALTGPEKAASIPYR